MKDQFLANLHKQTSITYLGEILEKAGVHVLHTSEDADTLIVHTAIKSTGMHTTIVMGEDTDLLVLLLVHADSSSMPIQLKSESRAQKHPELNIQHMKLCLGPLSQLLPFLHAIEGCNTTSRLVWARDLL